MRWLGQQGSGNVEDQRGSGGMGRYAIGGVGGVIVLILSFLFGGNLSDSINAGGDQPTTQQAPGTNPEQDQNAKFVSVVLKYTEDVWNKELRAQAGKDYVEPKLVLFSGQVQAGCGRASAASGPFYCPADQKVYIDLSFYDELKSRFQAPGDFAMAYVIAHEVGHHVQNLLGISNKVQALQQNGNEKEANALSVRLELQADFLAGVWAHHAQQMMNILEPGDIEEALKAASAIGDDRLQKQSQGYVVPDAFTHGTSAQRMHWFKKGFDTGDINQGDTFKDIETQ